jgi:hypothetical protein
MQDKLAGLGDLIYENLLQNGPAQPLPQGTGNPGNQCQANGVMAQINPLMADDEQTACPPADPNFKHMLKELGTFLRDTAFTAAPPAHIKPHFYSFAIDQSNTVAVPAAVMLPGAFINGLTYIVPGGCYARIYAYGVNVQDATYTYNGSLLWSILVNGRSFPSSDLSNWGLQRGSIVLPRKTVINLVEGDVVTMNVTRAILGTNGTQNVDMTFLGWTYKPRRLLDRSRGSIVYTG